MRTLRQLGTSGLYVPEALPSDLAAVFLRWAGAPPPTIPLDRTWADQGAPADVGYFVFLDAMPPPDAAGRAEAEMRAALGPPSATGFAWARWSTTVEVDTAVHVRLDERDRPVIADDVVVRLPPGLTALGFGAGAPVSGASDAAGLDALVVHYPPVAGAEAPRPDGVRIALAAPLLGALTFAGLVSLPVAPRPQAAVKSLVRVQLDPLRPLDPRRTRTTSTGRDFLLSHDTGGYHLAPLDGGGAAR